MKHYAKTDKQITIEEFFSLFGHHDNIYFVLEGMGQTKVETLLFRDVLLELESLANIGKAVEKAFKNNEYCIASYKGNHLNSFKTIEELLTWAESEEG